MSAELKAKLSRVETDLRGLREDRATAVRHREEAKEKYADAIANGGDEQEVHAEAMEAVRSFGEIEDKINVAQAQQVDLLKLLGDREEAARVSGSTNGQPPREGAEVDFGTGWDSGHLLQNEEIKAQLEFISHSQSRFGSVEIGEVAPRDVLVADIDGTATQRRGAYRGVRPAVYRPFSFLPLIPTGTTDGNLVPYTQENPVTGAALEVAEGAAKPEAGLTFTDADAPVRTIAAWMKTRKQALADVASLRSTMDTRLRYLVQKRLEEQVLAGDGSGVNLRGILNTAGIGTVAWNANVPLNEQILSGITNVFLNDGSADGVVLHPTDWMKLITEKAHFGSGAGAAGTAGSYEYYGGGPWGGTPSTVWGVSAVPSQSMTAGISVVGDFALGAQLLIRQGVTVLFSDSDQDDFIRNRVTMLAELRAALLVWRPSLFQSVDLAA